MAGCGCCAGCSPCIQVTFHDVLFDCGCLGFGGNSFNFTDIGLFNDTPLILCPDTGCDPLPPDICIYDNAQFPGCFAGDCDQVSLHFKIWLGVEDCSGAPFADRDGNDCEFPGISPYVVFTGGLWYVVIFAGGPLAFYGTAPDLSLPIPNQVLCNGTPTDWDDPTNCGIVSTQSYQGTAHGGTATVVGVSCP